jgi:hypothetical protein
MSRSARSGVALFAEALGGHRKHVTATRNATTPDGTAFVSTAARDMARCHPLKGNRTVAGSRTVRKPVGPVATRVPLRGD